MKISVLWVGWESKEYVGFAQGWTNPLFIYNLPKSVQIAPFDG